MFKTAHRRMNRRHARSFRPRMGSFGSAGQLETRVSPTSAFYWDPLNPLGLSQAIASSVVWSPDPGVTNVVTNPALAAQAGATSSSSLENVVVRRVVGPPPTPLAPAITISETGMVSTSNGLLPGGSTGSQHLIIEAHHLHGDMITNDTTTPFAIFDENFFAQHNQATEAYSLPNNPYRFQVRNQAGVFDPSATITVTASIDLDAVDQGFRQMYFLAFRSTHLNIDVGVGRPNGAGVLGLRITDPSRGVVIHQDPGFGTTTTYQYTMMPFTVPAQANEFYNYDSMYVTGPWGQIQPGVHAEEVNVAWSVGLSVNGG